MAKRKPNPHPSRRQFIKYGSAVGVGSVFAGCIGDDDDVDDDDPIDDDDDDTVADDDDDPVAESREFVYVTSQDPASIDPARSLDELEGIYNTHVYDGLLRYDYDFPPNEVPSIATDWEVADGGQTYTFDLRDDVTFHNGDSLTAEDVAFSVERMMTIRAGPSWMWDGILEPDGATVVDDTTVELELEQTYAPFVSTLPWLFIVNRDQALEHEENGDLGGAWLEDNDAGSGPYTLAEYDRGQAIHLERHDDWWGEFAENSYDEVELNIALEVSTSVGMMEAGDAHQTDRWLPTPIYEDLDGHDNVRVSETETFNTYYVFLNTRQPPLDDVHVRRALSWAFDYETAMDVLGAAGPFRSPVPEGMPYHTTEGVPQYERDLDRAEEELEDSEYDLEDLEFTYAYQPAIDANADMGLLMQDVFGEIGVTVDLEEMTWSRMVETSTDPDTAPQSFPLWGLVEYADPDAYMWSHYHSSQINTFLNGGKYENDEVDELLVEGRRTVDDDEREAIYHELQQRVAEDAPALFVANDATRYGLNVDVGGFEDNGIMGYTPQLQEMYHDG